MQETPQALVIFRMSKTGANHLLVMKVPSLSWLLSTSVPKMDGFPLMLSPFSYVRGIRIRGMRKFFVLDASHEALSSFYSSPWVVKA